jgi:hypothetical protein
VKSFKSSWDICNIVVLLQAHGHFEILYIKVVFPWHGPLFNKNYNDAGASPTHQASQHGAEDSWTSQHTNFENTLELLRNLK